MHQFQKKNVIQKSERSKTTPNQDLGERREVEIMVNSKKSKKFAGLLSTQFQGMDFFVMNNKAFNSAVIGFYGL